MALSSNSLVHLTKEKQSLIGILTENFKLKYCVEKVLTRVGTLSFAVPMVSFCDIPLSEIKDHIDKYGSYGIGLTKAWGQDRGLNPVFYVEKNSAISQSYHEVFNSMFKDKKLKVTDIPENDAKLLDIFRYMKNYEADLEREEEIQRNYRFADEKEWRYVTTKDESYMVINSKTYLERKADANELLKEIRLYFEPKDIKYIIVKHDHEITEFIDILRRTKKKYAFDDVERLITRIITTEQILSDF